MNTILHLVALLAFAVAAVIAFAVNNPDIDTLFGLVAIGAGLHEATHLVDNLHS